MIELPAGYSARGIQHPEDLDAVDALYAACDLIDVGFEDPSRAFLEENWRSERFSPPLDGVVVLAADGSVIAQGECSGRPGANVEAFIRVHPAHRGRGLGTAMIGWSENRGVAHALAGAKRSITNAVPATDTGAARLLLARGYTMVRTFWHMERSLGDLEPPAPAPAGIRLGPADLARDLPQVHDCIEESFAAHYGFTPEPFEEWRAFWLDAPEADPALFLVARDGDALVGALMGSRAERIGWVGELGVRSAARGRGIGEALLRTSFAAFAERGCTHARLNVDAGNATGATRLYERAGMSVRRQWHLYEKSLPKD